MFFTSFAYEPEGAVVPHIPAGVPTAERPPPEDLDDQEAAPYEPRPHRLFTLNLVVGTREDIAAGRWANFRYEQQY
ncbi:hypothetical protein [Streptomyces sp. NPDC005423]|uniref:hypothetical protein n=1 Tax=Streptomyces sp. NPDC005423 TaxID=3155343 RepID=UPI0033A96A83